MPDKQHFRYAGVHDSIGTLVNHLSALTYMLKLALSVALAADERSQSGPNEDVSRLDGCHVNLETILKAACRGCSMGTG